MLEYVKGVKVRHGASEKFDGFLKVWPVLPVLTSLVLRFCTLLLQVK